MDCFFLAESVAQRGVIMYNYHDLSMCMSLAGIVGGIPPARRQTIMECKIKNDIGTIYITEDVMLKVAGYAALECYGIVAMSSKRAKDGLVQWLGRENLSKGIQIKMVDDMLDVELFIIVEYGISIAEVCKTIVDTVRYKLESMTGVKVRRVNISVEGVRV
jgi:uncharacterized alkaline shock family protein YloU